MKRKLSKPKTGSFGTVSSIEGKAHVSKPEGTDSNVKKFVSPSSKVGKSRFSTT